MFELQEETIVEKPIDNPTANTMTEAQMNQTIQENGWSGKKSYKLKDNEYKSVITCGVLTGCGLLAITGLYNLPSITKEEWFKVAEKIRNDHGLNTLFAAVGDSFPKALAIMEEYGFQKIGAHHNIVHGNKYMQHLFLFEFDRNGIGKWKRPEPLEPLPVVEKLTRKTRAKKAEEIIAE